MLASGRPSTRASTSADRPFTDTRKGKKADGMSTKERLFYNLEKKGGKIDD